MIAVGFRSRHGQLRGSAETGELTPVENSGLGLMRDPAMQVLRRGNELVAMTPEVRTQNAPFLIGACIANHDTGELAWRTVPSWRYPDSTEWSIRLVPAGRRTTITQSFTVLRAPPRLLEWVYVRLIPGHQDRDARLAEDLARIGAVAAGRSVSP